MDQYLEKLNNEDDIKPIFQSSPTVSLGLSNLESSKQKWSPSLEDDSRKSAFLPYKVYTCNSMLTNLQRGNTITENHFPATTVSFHMKAGQGELTLQDVFKESDVNVKDCDNLTALHWASFYGQIHSVQLLIENGARVNEMGSEEETPLLLAASEGHLDVVRFLIGQGAEVNHVDHMCNTALMYAAKGNHPHTCQELLLNGINFSLENLNGDNAHTIAVENNSTLAQTVIENFLILQLESIIAVEPSGSSAVLQELSN
ncbi:ankyrin repeat family A protein 2-like [Diabrotica virgifera virgifera]|uniref:Ankyrin repeat family A protein 2 n=1 Tax=Diabrotica virgifera virgifera TaxID=50390 RepID=A0ABM5JM70_DIAVI|nr:ankyrin repeat family A protein 2-like [Diabrotica virgifera virgifera]